MRKTKPDPGAEAVASVSGLLGKLGDFINWKMKVCFVHEIIRHF
jgi:hypothetical protein